MPKSAEHIETSMRKLQRLGGVLCTVFALLFIATVVFGIWLVVSTIQQVGSGAAVMPLGVVEGAGASVYILPAVMWMLIALVLEVTAWSICRDMARGESPFTVRHAHLIAVLGMVFILNAVIGAIFRGNILIEGDVFGFSYWPNSMVVTFASGSGELSLDIGSLLSALVCFAISAMWRYAALLQAQTDDLV